MSEPMAANRGRGAEPMTELSELIARLQRANEYEPLGNDGWAAAEAILSLIKRVEEAEGKNGQAYQVVGNLLHRLGAFESNDGQRALDYFGLDKPYDDDFLPWPKSDAFPSVEQTTAAIRKGMK